VPATVYWLFFLPGTHMRTRLLRSVHQAPADSAAYTTDCYPLFASPPAADAAMDYGHLVWFLYSERYYLLCLSCAALLHASAVRRTDALITTCCRYSFAILYGFYIPFSFTTYLYLLPTAPPYACILVYSVVLLTFDCGQCWAAAWTHAQSAAGVPPATNATWPAHYDHLRLHACATMLPPPRRPHCRRPIAFSRPGTFMPAAHHRYTKSAVCYYYQHY